MERVISIPYSDYQKLVKDSTEKESVVTLLQTEFPDDTCQLIAIKSVLGLIEVEEEVVDPVDPPTTDPTDPPTTTDPTP